MQLIVKRLFDVFICFFVLIILMPILIIIGILIKFDSKGPIFYFQERIGLNNNAFKIIKFRSMVVNAENIGLKYRVVRDDPRITKIGHFIRKTSIDELPQLLNILKGEMSLIGPRPTLRFQVEKYTDFQKQRLKMKPGVTGLAQCRGRKSLNWDQRIRLDILYIQKYNLCLDIWIILETIKTMFNSNEVYRDSKSWIEK
ncbi:sugar transferase [Bacteroidota bacterium]